MYMLLSFSSIVFVIFFLVIIITTVQTSSNGSFGIACLVFNLLFDHIV